MDPLVHIIQQCNITAKQLRAEMKIDIRDTYIPYYGKLVIFY